MVDKQEWVHNLPDAALEWLGGRRVEEVECIVPDLVGISRGKTMPAKKFSDVAFFLSAHVNILSNHYRRLCRYGH